MRKTNNKEDLTDIIHQLEDDNEEKRQAIVKARQIIDVLSKELESATHDLEQFEAEKNQQNNEIRRLLELNQILQTQNEELHLLNDPSQNTTSVFRVKATNLNEQANQDTENQQMTFKGGRMNIFQEERNKINKIVEEYDLIINQLTQQNEIQEKDLAEALEHIKKLEQKNEVQNNQIDLSFDSKHDTFKCPEYNFGRSGEMEVYPSRNRRDMELGNSDQKGGAIYQSPNTSSCAKSYKKINNELKQVMFQQLNTQEVSDNQDLLNKKEVKTAQERDHISENEIKFEAQERFWKQFEEMANRQIIEGQAEIAKQKIQIENQHKQINELEISLQKNSLEFNEQLFQFKINHNKENSSSIQEVEKFKTQASEYLRLLNETEENYKSLEKNTKEVIIKKDRQIQQNEEQTSELQTQLQKCIQILLDKEDEKSQDDITYLLRDSNRVKSSAPNIQERAPIPSLINILGSQIQKYQVSVQSYERKNEQLEKEMKIMKNQNSSLNEKITSIGSEIKNIHRFWLTKELGFETNLLLNIDSVFDSEISVLKSLDQSLKQIFESFSMRLISLEEQLRISQNEQSAQLKSHQTYCNEMQSLIISEKREKNQVETCLINLKADLSKVVQNDLRGSSYVPLEFKSITERQLILEVQNLVDELKQKQLLISSKEIQIKGLNEDIKLLRSCFEEQETKTGKLEKFKQLVEEEKIVLEAKLSELKKSHQFQQSRITKLESDLKLKCKEADLEIYLISEDLKLKQEDIISMQDSISKMQEKIIRGKKRILELTEENKNISNTSSGKSHSELIIDIQKLNENIQEIKRDKEDILGVNQNLVEEIQSLKNELNRLTQFDQNNKREQGDFLSIEDNIQQQAKKQHQNLGNHQLKQSACGIIPGRKNEIQMNSIDTFYTTDLAPNQISSKPMWSQQIPSYDNTFRNGQQEDSLQLQKIKDKIQEIISIYVLDSSPRLLEEGSEVLQDLEILSAHMKSQSIENENFYLQISQFVQTKASQQSQDEQLSRNLNIKHNQMKNCDHFENLHTRQAKLFKLKEQIIKTINYLQLPSLQQISERNQSSLFDTCQEDKKKQRISIQSIILNLLNKQQRLSDRFYGELSCESPSSQHILIIQQFCTFLSQFWLDFLSNLSNVLEQNNQLEHHTIISEGLIDIDLISLISSRYSHITQSFKTEQSNLSQSYLDAITTRNFSPHVFEQQERLSLFNAVQLAEKYTSKLEEKVIRSQNFPNILSDTKIIIQVLEENLSATVNRLINACTQLKSNQISRKINLYQSLNDLVLEHTQDEMTNIRNSIKLVDLFYLKDGGCKLKEKGEINNNVLNTIMRKSADLMQKKSHLTALISTEMESINLNRIIQNIKDIYILNQTPDSVIVHSISPEKKRLLQNQVYEVLFENIGYKMAFNQIYSSFSWLS